MKSEENRLANGTKPICLLFERRKLLEFLRDPTPL